MIRDFEPINEGLANEPKGLPVDLLTDPVKYDATIPLWRRTVGFIREYQTARPQKKDKLVDAIAKSVTQNPTNIVHLINNLDLVAQLQPGLNVPDLEEQLVTQAEHAVAFRPDLPRWKPERIEGLVKLGLDNKGKVRQAVQRLEAALFNAPQTVEESVDLHYNAAWAMVSTNQPDIQEEIFSILCLEKPILNPRSPSALYFSLGVFALTDEILSRYFAAMDAIDQVGIFLETLNVKDKSVIDSERAWRKAHLLTQSVQMFPEVRELSSQTIQNIYKRNPKRFEAVSKTLYTIKDESPVFVQNSDYLEGRAKRIEYEEEMKGLQWPESVIKNRVEPLRKSTFSIMGPRIFKARWNNMKALLRQKNYERLSKRSIQIADDIELDVIAGGANSPEQKTKIIREVYETLISGKDKNFSQTLYIDMDKVLEEARNSFGLCEYFDRDKSIMFAVWRIQPEEQVGKLSSILEYHIPMFSLDMIEGVYQEVANLRRDIKTRFAKSVSKRGYEVIITDPVLRDMGYNSIEFKQGPSTNISANIRIDNQNYSFVLDQDFRIITGEDIKKFQNPQDQAWLELLTLTHLKKLMCTGEDDEELKAELLGGEKQLTHYRKQMVHKSEHLRHLPAGEKYSTRAFELCLNSHLPVKDLSRINRMRAEIEWGGTLKDGLWTYVSGIEKDIDTQAAKPVKVAFAHASDDIRKVIDLGAVSKEELSRLEKEILAELNVS